MSDSERMRILTMIENGEVSPEEGAERLARIDKKEAAEGKEPNEAMHVLEMLERGEISPDEAASRFQENSEQDDGPRMRYIRDEEAAGYFQNNLRVKRWQNWWTLPLWAGVGITVLASFWMYNVLQSTGTNIWFYCSFLPFFMGVAVMALAWASRSSPWLHVRVRQSRKNEDNKFSISIPLPIHPTAWVLHNFGDHIPHMDKTIVDEIIAALDKNKTDGKPFYIEVDDTEDGEHVEVFIG